MIARLRYVQKFKDRHGHVRLYLRRKGHQPVALPPENDPGFLKAYQIALAATAPEPVSRLSTGSLEAVARGYYTSAKFKQLGASTQVVYRRIIVELCRKHGTKPVGMLGTQHIQKWLDQKSDTPAAANHLLRTVRALMRYAKQTNVITTDPTVGVDRLKEVGQGTETWTEEDIAAYEARWPIGTRPRLALSLLLYTGQRRSDVVRMGRQHVNASVIEVRPVKSQGKTKLFIPLHGDLAECIALETSRLTFLITRDGRPFTSNGFYNAFKNWCADAGLPEDRSPHGLRKAACRRLADAGCSTHEIAAITGHKKLSEIELYTKAADQKRLARAAVAHIGRPKD